MGRYIDTDDLKDLMYVACMGQDKQFIKMFETVINDCPDAHISIKEIIYNRFKKGSMHL